MKRLAVGFAAVLALTFAVGCGSGGGNTADDSMATTLEKGKKDQGLSDNNVKPKDSPNLKAPPAGSDTTAKPSGDTAAPTGTTAGK